VSSPTTDEYEGHSTDPLSLHKYLYANANPVEAFDPSGRNTMTLPGLVNVARLIGEFCRVALPAIRPAMITLSVGVIIVTMYYVTSTIELEDIFVWSSNKDTQKKVDGLLRHAARHAEMLAALAAAAGGGSGGDPNDPKNWNRNKWKGEVKAALDRAKRLVEKGLKNSKQKAEEYLRKIQEIADKSGVTLD
jgi:hypothetical protein